MQATVYDCNIIHLPKIENTSGSITPIHSNKEVPFDIKRIYYLYDVPGGANRGGHGHRTLHQLVVAAGGSFDIILDDGHIKRTVQLNRPYYGLYIPPGIWRDISNFSSGAICLVLASDFYNAAEYIRDYEEFKMLKEQ
jgi:hypothetical protein